jgi:hypothetical protein
MPLNSSGPISLGGSTAGQSIAVELGQSATAQISLNDAAVRELAGVPSGAITMPTNFYGKSSSFVFNQTISSDTTNYNLKSAAIAAGWNQTKPLVATVTINGGVYVYSTSTGTYAFDTGSTFPAGTSLNLINNGVILGRGGDGGNGGVNQNGQGGAGGAGGPAFIARYAINVTNNGTIGGRRWRWRWWWLRRFWIK